MPAARDAPDRAPCVLAIETATEACSVALVAGETLVLRHELAPRRHAELVLPMIDGLLAETGLARGAIDAIAVGRGPGAFTGVRLAVSVAQGLALGLGIPVVPVSTLAALALEAVDAFDAFDAESAGASAPPTGIPGAGASLGARSGAQAGAQAGAETAAETGTGRGETGRGGGSVGGAQAPTSATPLIVAAIDARMGEVYVACYEVDADGLVTAVTAEAVCEASRCSIPVRQSYVAAGTGWAAYREALASCLPAPPSVVLPELLPRASSVARLALRELARGNTVDAAHAQPVYLRDKVALTVAEQAAQRAK